MARKTRREIEASFNRLQRDKDKRAVERAFRGTYATDFLGVVDLDAILSGQRISERLTEATPVEERTEVRRRIRRVREQVAA